MLNQRIKDGDIIACVSRGWVSDVINLGTFALPGRGISHVGMVAASEYEPLVYESTTFARPPCHLQKEQVEGVQAHQLDIFLNQYGPGQQVWHYPLKRALYRHEQRRLLQVLDGWIGKPYDMPGAIRSGGMIFRTLQALLRPEDMSSIFCSEMVAGALSEVGVMQTRTAGKWNPNRLCRHLVRRGVCDPPRRLK